MPPTDPLAWIATELDRLAQAGLRRRLATRSGPQSARVNVNGKELVNFGSNDYLGLAADERLRTASQSAIERDGWGSGASPLISGRSESHAELERRLAEFEGAEAALVFSSGFAANAGIIPALVDEGDAVFGDAKNHASLIDGCRLSKAQRFVYPHANCDALELMLCEAGRFRRRLIVTDTLFSMDGDVAPLVHLAELAERYDAMLMVDEAHATGVFGDRGRGIVEFLDAGCWMLDAGSNIQLPGSNIQNLASSIEHPASSGTIGTSASESLQHRVHIRVGTLSKALGGAGGFVCGSRSLIDWLANRARTYVFSTAQPAATYAAALAALDIVRNEPHRRIGLLERAATLRSRLSAQGWNTAQSSSHIIPLIIGDADRTMRLAASLCDAGFCVPGIRPPSVPEGQSLLRLSLCYNHTQEMIDALVEQLARLRNGSGF